MKIADKDYRVSSACGVVGIMNESGERCGPDDIIRSIALMRERSNGLGGGFAAYGIYPEHAECFAFHVLCENEQGRKDVEGYLSKHYDMKHQEPIPSRRAPGIGPAPILMRYFVMPRFTGDVSPEVSGSMAEEFVVKTVMHVNANARDAFIASSGKNMGIFKGVGFPEDIAEFYRLEDYKAYTWTAHGRFPTNSVSWWGGAHPFGLLDWSVVHNGEISSYGINRRYLENFGYRCTMFTDTEVIAYIFDLLVRKHGLSFETASRIVSARFWQDIDGDGPEKAGLDEQLRIIYSSALVNGPFGIIVANKDSMVGLTDRIKLRPMVAARKGDFVYIASEESAIMEVCPSPDIVFTPDAGSPVIARLKECHVH